MKDDDITKTTFRMQYGHYEFIVMLFGHTNTLAIFMDLINRFFREHLDMFSIVFIDDILIYSKTKEQHKEHLRMVLQILKEHRLFAKFSKCDVWRWEVKFLGYVVTSEGIAIDPSKVEAVLNFECRTLEDL